MAYLYDDESGKDHLVLDEMIQGCTADSTKWFPQAQKLDTMVLCMAGEVGEVANLVKKIVRGSITVDEAMDEGLAEEIIDVLIYLCNLMGLKEFQTVDWKAIWDNKRSYNESRFGTIEQAKEMLSQNLYTGDLNE
jgi:NTP pyrophosphatase (non-canonical NTP hydrolase)